MVDNGGASAYSRGAAGAAASPGDPGAHDSYLGPWVWDLGVASGRGLSQSGRVCRAGWLCLVSCLVLFSCLVLGL